MILVKALDSFLYQTKHVNTGQKINVEEKDIPKLVDAKKISPAYLDQIRGIRLDVIISDEYEPGKFLKQPEKKTRKSKKNK